MFDGREVGRVRRQVQEPRADGVQNGGESGVDCGPVCAAPCRAGSPCLHDTDCTSGVCAFAAGLNLCAAPSCNDGVHNGTETWKDCDGGCPAKCPPGTTCLSGSDCAGGACAPATLTCAPTCTDGYFDGAETDVDCGGPCPLDCDVGLHCAGDDDCVSQSCYLGHCYP